MYSVASVCLCVINFCNQDISKTIESIFTKFIIDTPYIPPRKRLSFGAYRIQNGWFSVILVFFHIIGLQGTSSVWTRPSQPTLWKRCLQLWLKCTNFSINCCFWDGANSLCGLQWLMMCIDQKLLKCTNFSINCCFWDGANSLCGLQCPYTRLHPITPCTFRETMLDLSNNWEYDVRRTV